MQKMNRAHLALLKSLWPGVTEAGEDACHHSAALLNYEMGRRRSWRLDAYQ